MDEYVKASSKCSRNRQRQGGRRQKPMDSARPTPPLRGGDGETVSWTRPGALTSHFSPGPTARPMTAPRAAPTRPTPPALAGRGMQTKLGASGASQSSPAAYPRAAPTPRPTSAPIPAAFPLRLLLVLTSNRVTSRRGISTTSDEPSRRSLSVVSSRATRLPVSGLLVRAGAVTRTRLAPVGAPLESADAVAPQTVARLARMNADFRSPRRRCSCIVPSANSDAQLTDARARFRTRGRPWPIAGPGRGGRRSAPRPS